MRRPLAHTHIAVVRKRGPDQCQGFIICQLQQVRLYPVTYTAYREEVNDEGKGVSDWLRDRLVPWLQVG